MTMRCYIGFDALFFCKLLARWGLQKPRARTLQRSGHHSTNQAEDSRVRVYIINDAVMSINKYTERHRCGCSTDDTSCICKECKSIQSELSVLRDEHRALVYIKDRLLDDYQSTLSGIPHLFEPYSIVTTKPISDALHELSPSRDTSLMDRVERLDRYCSPITFFTFLRLRIELILEFKCKAAVLLSIVHFCRRRNLTIDLLADLQRSCRKSSKTGIRRWLTRVEIRRCIVARKLQKDFMQSLRISIA